MYIGMYNFTSLPQYNITYGVTTIYTHGNFHSHASKSSGWDVTTIPASSSATGKIEGLN